MELQGIIICRPLNVIIGYFDKFEKLLKEKCSDSSFIYTKNFSVLFFFSSKFKVNLIFWGKTRHLWMCHAGLLEMLISIFHNFLTFSSAKKII